MKCLQIGPYPKLEILDLPVPEPGAGQAVMRIDAVTTCPQWDLHLKHNEPMFVGHQFHYPYTPGQPGHEATGVVHALGTGVDTLKVGDHVSAWRDAGHHVNGCYAQYVVVPAENLIKVPAELSLQATAPVELAMCVGASFLMLKAMNVIEGRVFGISGLGPAGLIAAQMARAEGATRVVGFEPSEARRMLALERQIVDVALAPDASDDSGYPCRPARPVLDTSLDCVGAKASVEGLMARTLDTIALFGVQREDYAFRPMHYHPPLRLCGYPGHSREAAEYAVSLMAAGKIDLSVLVTHTMPLWEYNRGIEMLERQEAIKVCFLPWS